MTVLPPSFAPPALAGPVVPAILLLEAPVVPGLEAGVLLAVDPVDVVVVLAVVVVVEAGVEAVPALIPYENNRAPNKYREYFI